VGAKAFACQVIAQTGGELADFGPYVAAINDLGTVAFRAQTAGGGSSLFVGEAGPVQSIEVPAGELIGHPDLDNSGGFTFITTNPATGPAMWMRSRDGSLVRAQGVEPIAEIGPRGPVMNDSDCSVFCARLITGEECVMKASGGRLEVLARAGERFRAFPGLPVVNREGAVAFAALLAAGGATLLLSRSGTLTTVADTENEFRELSAFPALNDAGQTAFTGRLKSGPAGAFRREDGRLHVLSDGGIPFENFRSVLQFGTGGLILCATPRGGQLGVYRGAGPDARRLIGLGDPFQDSTVADFALNAVSVNSTGQIALRLRLANGRQIILRAETSAP
jgi:hypothetical protein